MKANTTLHRKQLTRFSARLLDRTCRALGAVVLLGPPGAGKGTQAKRLAAEWKVPWLSTGDLLRRDAAKSTGLETNTYGKMHSGLLMDDDLICRKIAYRIGGPNCNRGYILDGFPRTVSQAEWFERYLTAEKAKPDPRGEVAVLAILLNVEERELLRRLNARESCPVCGQVFSIPPDELSKAKYCGFDGAQLIIRRDDAEEVIPARLKSYREQTLPVVEYYRAKAQLREVDANRDAGSVLSEILDILRFR